MSPKVKAKKLGRDLFAIAKKEDMDVIVSIAKDGKLFFECANGGMVLDLVENLFVAMEKNSGIRADVLAKTVFKDVKRYRRAILQAMENEDEQ